MFVFEIKVLHWDVIDTDQLVEYNHWYFLNIITFNMNILKGQYDYFTVLSLKYGL